MGLAPSRLSHPPPMTGRFDRLRFLAPLGLAFGLMAGVFVSAGYRINLSASFPPGWYRVRRSWVQGPWPVLPLALLVGRLP